MQKIWFITGVSGGIGKALALAAARKGHLVYGTLRTTHHKAEFENLVPGYTLPLLLDVCDGDMIQSVSQEVIAKHGAPDVVVNNAGYGLFGAIEEVSMEEARKQMETNFFGALQVCKAFIPAMRQKEKGHILQISSVAGFRGAEGLGIYNASKFALEGFSQAMQKELLPFNVHVTLVEPGPFRTDWGGRSSIRSAEIIEAYSHTAGARIRAIHTYSGTQPGDPDKAADLILEVVESPNPPLHLPLGEMAIQGFREKMRGIENDIQNWEEKSRNTAF